VNFYFFFLFRSVQNQPDITMAEAEELAVRTLKSSPSGLLSPREAKKLLRIDSLASVKEEVVVQIDPISEDLGLTQEATNAALLRVAWKPLLDNQYILRDSLTVHTEGLVEVAEDLINDLEAGELRTTLLEDDVGGRTAESGARSLLQLAAAAEGGIDVIDNLCTSLSIEVGELRAAVETAVGDTYKVVL
jgi:hypothetical protein